MSKIPQTPAELDSHLREQLEFLRLSSASYDHGFEAEAKRLATIIRVLVHDTNGSKSLLGLMGLKATMRFLDTSDDDYLSRSLPHGTRVFDFLAGALLVQLTITTGNDRTRWTPKCFCPPPSGTVYDLKPFNKWWSKVVITDQRGRKFTRQNVVLTLVNKRGGAHVDPELDSAYVALTRNNSMGWTFAAPHNEEAITNIESATCRQIAEEVLRSMEVVRPDLAGEVSKFPMPVILL